MNLRILVLGCGDVGSAVAHRLFMHGADVVISDVPAPAHPRRGMAFTDAWFDGTATLEGVVALWIADTKQFQSHWGSVDAIAATDEAPDSIAGALRLDAIVDARMRKRSVPDDLRALAPAAIGLGPGFTPGSNCTVAIETAWGEPLGAVLRDTPSQALSGEPRPLGGAGRERFVYSAEAGPWLTSAHIGDLVAEGAPIGKLSGHPFCAPIAGTLRGLTRDGVNVAARQKLVEIDPRAQPDAHGLGLRPIAIARGVARALGLPTGLQKAFFDFEAEFRESLDCIPMSMRVKLDCCGLKLSLEQWRSLPRPLREVLLETPVETPRQATHLARLLSQRGQRLGWPELPQLQAEDILTDDPHVVPHAISMRCTAEAWPGMQIEQWAALTPLQRYVLRKLAGQRSSRNWQPALVEFGVHGQRG